MTIDIEPDAVNFGLGPILHRHLPEVPWTSAHTNRLPGITPMKDRDWLRVDHTYARQMTLRDILAAARLEEVTACLPRAKEAAQELLATVIDDLCERGEFVLEGNAVRRPDGVVVNIGEPMPTLLRLVSEDLCILVKEDGEHVLVAAALGFPASWTLAQKIGKPLIRIHKPVESYGDELAKRVQRMFDGLHVGKGLVRMNALRYSDCELFHPREEDRSVDEMDGGPKPFIRTERQCLVRLPKTDAVVFSIHTRIVTGEGLSDDQRKALAETTNVQNALGS